MKLAKNSNFSEKPGVNVFRVTIAGGVTLADTDELRLLRDGYYLTYLILHMLK